MVFALHGFFRSKRERSKRWRRWQDVRNVAGDVWFALAALGIVSDCLMWSSSDFPGSFSESIGISPIYRVGYLANGCELNAGS